MPLISSPMLPFPRHSPCYEEGRARVLRAVEKEKGVLTTSLRKYRPHKRPPRKPTKSDLAKEVAFSQDLIREVKGKYSLRVEELAKILEKVVDPEGKRKIVSFVDHED